MGNKSILLHAASGLMAVLICTAFVTGAHAQGFGSEESFVQIHGYTDLTYRDFEKDGDPMHPFTDNGGGTPTFQNAQFALFFGANLSPNLKFISEIHWEQTFSEPELEQANMQWQLAKPLTMTLGRFWLPFGTLNKYRVYEPTNRLVTFPYTNTIWLFSKTQNGIELGGEIDPFSYELAISNGFAGLDEDAGKFISGGSLDNNHNKQVTGRAVVLPVKGMDIGASYTTMKWDDNDKANLNLWGVDAEYKVGPLNLQAEYLGGHVQNPDNAVATVDGTVRCNPAATDPSCAEPNALRDNMGPLSPGNHNLASYYVQAAYLVLNNQLNVSTAEVIVRYDALRRDETKNLLPGEAKNQGDRNRFTAGINVSPQPHFHLKAEYQWVSEPGDQQSLKNNGVIAQAVVDF